MDEQEVTTESVEQEPKLSRLQQYAKEKYPDQEFSDDDAIAESLIKNNSELEGNYTKAQEVTKKLVAVFSAYPDVRAFIGDLIMGAKPRAAWAKYWSKDDLEPQEGDDDEEEWKKNVADRETRMAEENKRRDKLAENYEFTGKEFEEWKPVSGLSEEQTSQFVEWVDGILNDIYEGRISREALTFLKKAWRFDEEVKDAENLGVLKGKSEQIKAKKDIVKKGDGLPSLNGAGDVKEQPKKQQSYFGQIAQRHLENKLL